MTLYEALGDPFGVARGRYNLARAACIQGDYGRAALLEETLATFLAMGNSKWVAFTRYELGITAYGLGELARAIALLEEAVRLNREVNDPYLMDVSLQALGLLASEQGDQRRAAALFAESRPLWQDIGEKEGHVEWLAGVAAVAAAAGKPEPAARLFGAAESWRESLSHAFTLPSRATYERAMSSARAALEEQPFAVAWAAGRSLTIDQATAEASALLAELTAPTTTVGKPAARHGLTPKEQEVLCLLAKGLSNSEIAAALFISPPPRAPTSTTSTPSSA